MTAGSDEQSRRLENLRWQVARSAMHAVRTMSSERLFRLDQYIDALVDEAAAADEATQILEHGDPGLADGDVDESSR